MIFTTTFEQLKYTQVTVKKDKKYNTKRKQIILINIT